MIEVLRAGVLTTVQDLGRSGFQHHGVPVSGAMDPLSLRTANLLVGNPEHAAALEFTLVGPSLAFDADALIALCGGDFGARLGDTPVPMARPVAIAAGSVLEFANCRLGCRGYLAVAGGIGVEPVLGSRSTYLRAGFGGFEGRALKRGDRLAADLPEAGVFPGLHGRLSVTAASFVSPHWAASLHPERMARSPQIIRFVAARHWESLHTDVRARFLGTDYRLGADSDRMGYRLEGGALEQASDATLLSAGVAFGTIQLPPDGNPIVLMADRQTTGGYPRLGEVAGVDLPLLGQLKPGDSLRFEKIALAEAQKLWLVQEQAIAQLHEAILAHIRE